MAIAQLTWWSGTRHTFATTTFPSVPSLPTAVSIRRCVGRCDIYVGFIEAGVRQLKDGGMLAFICADRWMRSAYGAELRRFIAENCGVDVVIEMHNAPAFEYEVAAYPAVVILRRAPQGKAIVASAGADAGPLSTGQELGRCCYQPCCAKD